MRFFLHIARFAVWLIMCLFSDRSVTGRDNIPENGPVLVVSNHMNLADPPIISISLNRLSWFMAKEELFSNWFTGYFIRSFGAFPVKRGQIDRRAISHAIGLLKKGEVLVMFPEAARSTTGSLQPAYSGSALIAARSKVPILPVGISGTENMKGFWYIRHPRIDVRFGKPFHLPPPEGKVTRQYLDDMTDLIMNRIAALLPEEYHGHYSVKGETNDAES